MLVDLFGSGRELGAVQMSARAFAMFFTLLLLARLSGMRSFGRKSSFDTVIAITLGAVLSRVIVGASPALPTIAAAVVLALLHRIVGVVTATFPALERLIKGRSHWLYRGGIFDLPRMHRAGISRADLEEAVRRYGHIKSLADVREVRLESSGELTVIDPQPA